MKRIFLKIFNTTLYNKLFYICFLTFFTNKKEKQRELNFLNLNVRFTHVLKINIFHLHKISTLLLLKIIIKNELYIYFVKILNVNREIDICL